MPLLQTDTVAERQLCTSAASLRSLRMDADSDYDSFFYDNWNDTDELLVNFTLDCPDSNLGISINVSLSVLYYLIFLTGFLGNLFVIYVVGLKGDRGGRLVDKFVVNLALADLVFVLTLPLWAVSAGQDGRWELGTGGDLLCKLSSYLIAVNRYSNIFFLTCMSVDRYLAVVKSVNSRRMRTVGCVRVTCAVVWLSSLVLGVPFLVYRRVEQHHEHGLSCVEDSSSYFFLCLSLVTVLFAFVFPVLIIVFCYSTIIIHLNKHCADFASANARSRGRHRHSIRMVLCIIAAFVVSWLPFNVFKVVLIVSRLSETDLECGPPLWQRHGLVISCCLAFFNSCVNPAIYLFLDRHFRRRAAVLVQNCRGDPMLAQSFNSTVSESLGTKVGRQQA